MQRRILLITALVLSTAWAAAAANIVGDWQGTLKVGSAELHLVLHIAKGSDGALKANLDIVDRGANGIPVTSIALEQSRLAFTVESVHGFYQGAVNADATVISETWSPTRFIAIWCRPLAERCQNLRFPRFLSQVVKWAATW
jgi:hypothetical protein